MNENELNGQSSKVDTYHATTNLNIDIENPQIHMNSAVGMNIKDVHSNNYANPQISDDSINNYTNFNQNLVSNNFQNNYSTNEIEKSTSGTNLVQNQPKEEFNNHFQSPESNQFISNNLSSYGENNQYVPNADLTSHVVYEPTMEERKKKRTVFSLSMELKVTIFIVFILFIFILLMPYVYDFFKNLQLAFTR